MKANEFVKKFGWGKTKEIIAKFHNNELQSCCFDSGLINGEDKSWWDICVYDLKRLVESHDLVQVGLPELKKVMFSDSKDLESVKNWILTVSDKLLTEKGVELKKAILDVESCQ